MTKELLKMQDHSTVIDNSVSLPAILVINGRQQFRKMFIKNYPSFIHCLRRAIPEITACEELLCMLIYLKQSNNDIAAVLSINRKSVNQARYRLKQKISLSEKVLLDEFVCQLTAD